MSQYEDDADLLFEECPNCGELNLDCKCSEDERETKMATLTDKQVTALQQRHDFWAKKENDAIEAGDAEALTTASNGKDKVIAEARAGGATLIAWSAPEPVAVTATATATEVVPPKGKGTGKTPRSVTESAAVADKAKKVAAAKGEKTPEGATKAKVARVKKEKVLVACLDGCGAMVGGNFKMGHDAKLKSLILKIERGEEEIGAIPTIAQGLVTFKKGDVEKNIKDGKTVSTTQLYICTKAPVRFPGREMVLTTRE